MKSALRLVIDSLAFGGDGIGRHEGLAVFVPGAAPGDVLDAVITRSTRTFARARIARIVEPGPGRLTPPCGSFPECGGCQWQHVNYGTQFEAKVDILKHALRRFGEPQFTGHPAPEPFGYRRRARLAFSGDKRLHAGFRARQSDRIVDASACIQLVPALQNSLSPLRSWLASLGRLDGEVELLANHHGQILIAVNPRKLPGSPLPAQPDWCAGLSMNEGGTSLSSGAASIELDARGLHATARAFTQANASQDAVLRQVVLGWTDRVAAASVLEFHAGIGNFTFDLVSRGLEVTAVESNPDACRLLAANLRGSPLTLNQADAERFEWKNKPDCILLDPPREGAPALIRRIAASEVNHVIYVSCDPMTLARDIQVVSEAGFRLRDVALIDMMPQTYHIETACLLSRI